MTLPGVWLAAFVTVFWCGSPFATVSADPRPVSAGVPPDQQAPRLVLRDDSTELAAALAARTPAREVAVRVAGFSVPDADPTRARLLILAEIGGTGVSQLASVAYVVEDERGQAKASGLRRGELRWTSGGTLAFSDSATLAPGAYRLKLAVMQNDKVGTAQAAVIVRVRSVSTLRLGDLAVGESAGEDVASSASVAPLVRGDRLVVSVGAATAGPMLPSDTTASVEVARDAAGAPVVSAPAALLTVPAASPAPVAPAAGAAPSSSPRPGPDRLVQGVLDIRSLPPGTYEARVVVAIGGQEAARITAPFTREMAASTPAPSATRPRDTAANAPLPVAGFRADDVLDAAVLRPFLDDLAGRAASSAKPAIDQAKSGRFAEAARAAAAADSDGPAAPFLTGLSLFSQKQLQAASEAFRDTLRAAPDFFAGAFYIGACYAAGGRDPQAVNAWQTSLVGLDGYPVVFRLLAEALLRMGQPERALEVLDEAIAKWPGDADMRLRGAHVALAAKRYDRVFTLVDEGMTGPQPPPDLLLAGIQAVYQQASQRTDSPGAETIARARRYRDAYTAAGGTQQALVTEWLGVLERKR